MDMLTILGLKKQEDETEELDTKVNIHTLYKHRCVWYHLILCIQMILTNVLNNAPNHCTMYQNNCQ